METLPWQSSMRAGQWPCRRELLQLEQFSHFTHLNADLRSSRAPQLRLMGPQPCYKHLNQVVQPFCLVPLSRHHLGSFESSPSLCWHCSQVQTIPFHALQGTKGPQTSSGLEDCIMHLTIHHFPHPHTGMTFC